MKVSPLTLESNLPPSVTEGIFTPEEGLQLPFVLIPSPSDLNSWSQAFPAATNTQGRAGVSGAGPSNLGQTTQGLVPEQVIILGTAPFYTAFQPIGLAPPSGCFIGIPKHDQASEGNQSDYEDIGLEEGEQAAKSRPKQAKKSRNSKIRERDRRLIFGEGISMAQAALTESTVLVGRVRGQNYSQMHLRKWTT